MTVEEECAAAMERLSGAILSVVEMELGPDALERSANVVLASCIGVAAAIAAARAVDKAAARALILLTADAILDDIYEDEA